MWIEISMDGFPGHRIMSRPARALWIEIDISLTTNDTMSVEAREGLVD